MTQPQVETRETSGERPAGRRRQDLFSSADVEEHVQTRFDEANRMLAQSPPALTPLERTPTPTSSTGPFPPKVAFSELTPAGIDTALAASGCVHVTGLLDADVVAELVAGIDQAFASYDEVMASGTLDGGDEWCRVFVPEMSPVHLVRPWLRSVGGMFVADSPRFSARWFGLLRDRGVLELVTDVFGEPPITSLDKSTLRRVRSGNGNDWHQDGAFLGPDSGALNLWVALTDTELAPGLDVVGGRVDEVLETGTGSAVCSWTIAPEVMDPITARTPAVQPRFAPGDGLFFDSFLIHRTQQEPIDLPNTRYAIESWFFPPSRFPGHQEVPLAL